MVLENEEKNELQNSEEVVENVSEETTPEENKEEAPASTTMQFLQQMQQADQADTKPETTTTTPLEATKETFEEATSAEILTSEEDFPSTSVEAKSEESASTNEQDAAAEEEEEEEELEDLQEEDFSNWTIEQAATRSGELAAKVKDGGKINFKRIDRTLQSLKDHVNQINADQRAEALAKFTEGGGDPESFKYVAPDAVNQFFENFKFLRQQRREYFENLEQQKDQNLLEKRAIVGKIKDLIDSVQDPEADNRKDFAKMKELQEQWKKVGHVPQGEADNLYKTYRAVVDMFYNQKSMERELLELDRKKNQKLKEALCEKAEALVEAPNIHKAVKELNALHQEYKNIGPVPREVQEDLWQRFKAASDKVYDKKHAEVEAFKKELEENMKAKQALCIEIESYLEFDSDRIKEWNTKTREVLALQKKWEDIGAAPREVAKSINKQFWGNFKTFFANKSKFFEKLEGEREENLKKKTALCERAEEVKDSFEWDEVTNELKKLQRDWKNIGPVPKAQRETLYQRFKTACDAFFERKRNRKAEQEKEFVYNLEKKEVLCAEIETLAQTGSKDLGQFEEICIKFEKAGFVPRDQMDKIQDRFMAATDKFFAQLDMSADEREQFKLQMQFRALGDSPKALAKFKKQEGGIIRKIEHIRKDIRLWETNLDFFAKSKTADKLRAEFEAKIGGAEQEIKELERKLQLIKKIKKGDVPMKTTKPAETKEEVAQETTEATEKA